jgi:hypothetical protein
MSDTKLDRNLEALRRALTGPAPGGKRPAISALAEQFMDIADDPDLLRLSRPAEDAFVRSALEAATRHVTGKAKFHLPPSPCYRYAPAGFLHGTFVAVDRMATFFWFEAGAQGVLTLMGRDLRSMDHVHLGAAPVPPGSNVVSGSGTPQ